MIDLFILTSAIAAWAYSAFLSDKVMHEVIRHLPPHLAKDGAGGRHVYAQYVLTPMTPLLARRQHLTSSAFAFIAYCGIAAVAWRHEFPLGQAIGTFATAASLLGFIKDCKHFQKSDHW